MWRSVNTYSGKALRIIECCCRYKSCFDKQLQEVWLAKLMVTGLAPYFIGTVISNNCRMKMEERSYFQLKCPYYAILKVANIVLWVS